MHGEGQEHANQAEGQLFWLDGPAHVGDPRITPIRGDLADIALAGKLFAPHYVVPMPRVCAVPQVLMREKGEDGAKAVSELLLGEQFDVLDVSGGWAWGRSAHDHYLGYVPMAALGEMAAPAAYVVAAHTSQGDNGDTLPMGAKLTADAAAHFPADDLVAIGTRLDPVSQAEKMLGAPYVWGGRAGNGPDCSGLIQTVLALAGKAVPRDADQQLSAIGEPLAADAPLPVLARGDIVFFPDHVGIMADATDLIHATGHHGAVVREPLADVLARIAQKHEHTVLGMAKGAA